VSIFGAALQRRLKTGEVRGENIEKYFLKV